VPPSEERGSKLVATIVGTQEEARGLQPGARAGVGAPPLTCRRRGPRCRRRRREREDIDR